MVEFLVSALGGAVASVVSTFLIQGVLSRKKKRVVSIEVDGRRITIDLNDENDVMRQLSKEMNTPRIFVSYSHRDKEVAEEISNKVQSAGLRLWHDTDQIRPGENILKRIEEGIRQSSYFLVLFSNNWLDSSWANKELQKMYEQERDGTAKIILVRVDEAIVPEWLAQRLYIDYAKDPQSLSDFLKQIVSREPQTERGDSIRTAKAISSNI